MKALIFFTVILALTGCVSEEHKPKVYRHEIKFHQPEKLKILYTEPEESAFEKYYRAHPIETDIAEIKLETHRIRKVTAHMEKFLKEAEERLKKFQEFAARKKAEIAERAEYRQQIEEMPKELKQINANLEQQRKKQELKYGY
jgi:septal ring factor EnvC (AmiA/AmiB activator)